MKQTILLTGATSGIGKSLVETLGNDDNYELILMGRSQDKLDAFTQSNVTTYCVDLIDSEKLSAVVNEITAKHDIDILINNAGIGLTTPLSDDDVLEKYDAMMDTNMKSIVIITAGVLKQMKKRKSESLIINISSEVGLKSNPVAPLYCSTKHALEAYSDGLRQQLRVDGESIRVTVIRPGAIDTNYWAGRGAPVEKFLTPKEVSDTLLYVINSPKTVTIRSIDLESFRK